MQFSGQNITAEIGSSEGDIPTTDEHGQPRKRDNIYQHEESTIDIIRRAMRLRRRPAHRGLLLPTIGRDTPLRTHCLWRDTHLQRLTHRHRLPLPLQRIRFFIMYIKLIRNQPKGNAITGRLVIDGRWFCDTMERVGYQIPAICYPVRVTQSPKFKRLLPIVQNVPQRSGIRFHRGTKPQHSTGCILLPDRETENKFTNLLLDTQKHEEIILEVIDFRPGTELGYNTPCPPELQKP